MVSELDGYLCYSLSHPLCRVNVVREVMFEELIHAHQRVQPLLSSCICIAHAWKSSTNISCVMNNEDLNEK